MFTPELNNFLLKQNPNFNGAGTGAEGMLKAIENAKIEEGIFTPTNGTVPQNASPKTPIEPTDALVAQNGPPLT